MQRSLSHQKPLAPVFALLGFAVYSSLSTIYLFVPPLFALLYVMFARALKREDTLYIFFIFLALMIFEANFHYFVFSSIIYFYLLYQVIMPKITQSFSCKLCIRIASVALAYIGYYLFLLLLSNIFLLEAPQLSYYIIYYIIIEFFLVSLLYE